MIVGARGTGKTALLARIRDIAQQHGWIAVGATAIDGLLTDIEEQTAANAEHILTPGGEAHFTSIGVGPVSAAWTTDRKPEGNWRTRMTRLIDQLAEADAGLLITVDVVRADLPEMIRLAAVYQHFVTENRKVSLVMAGLPFQVHQLVSDKSVSFLRRASLQKLGMIDDSEIAAALKQTFELGGKGIEGEALDLCTRASGGFPYMLQLVGYRTWAASGESPLATSSHAEMGIEVAEHDFDQRVLDATYRELSAVDRRFLAAMLPDARESRLAGISRRMGVKSNYATKYKSRLLAQGVIEELGRNVFTFSVPRLRGYLRVLLAEDGVVL